MVRTWLCCIFVFVSASGHVPASPAVGEELLVNGDFEIGKPEDDKSDTFVCKAWRRLLWKETLPNSWLTNGKRDRPVGHGNQALEYRWGATSVCQYFSAKAGETYLDNASVRGTPGPHNLPVSFASSPYDMVLDPISESRPFDDSLTNYADDKDGDSLTFTDSVVVRASGITDPQWVRFAWHETAAPTLMNVAGLPANSFVAKVGTLRVP